jgi:hypothetical protein
VEENRRRIVLRATEIVEKRVKILKEKNKK